MTDRTQYTAPKEPHGKAEDDFLYLSVSLSSLQFTSLCTQQFKREGIAFCSAADLVDIGNYFAKRLWLITAFFLGFLFFKMRCK